MYGSMIDNLKNLGVQAGIVAIVGGIIAYLLAMLTAPIMGFDAMFGPLIGGIIAITILLYVAKETALDAMTFFNIIVLLLFVSIIGTFIVAAVPTVAPFILTLAGSMSISTWAWSLVYVGIALLTYDKIMDAV
jgi:hypothetical protein